MASEQQNVVLLSPCRGPNPQPCSCLEDSIMFPRQHLRRQRRIINAETNTALQPRLDHLKLAREHGRISSDEDVQKYRRLNMLDECKYNPAFRQVCKAMRKIFDDMRADMKYEYLGTTYTSTLDLFEGILPVGAISKTHWTEDALGHLKVYLEDRYTALPQWRFSAQIRDPWQPRSTEEKHRPACYNYLKVTYTFEYKPTTNRFDPYDSFLSRSSSTSSISTMATLQDEEPVQGDPNLSPIRHFTKDIIKPDLSELVDDPDFVLWDSHERGEAEQETIDPPISEPRGRVLGRWTNPFRPARTTRSPQNESFRR